MQVSFVAFFDILGFKDLVEGNSHEELLEIYNESLYRSLEIHDNIYEQLYPIITPKEELDSIKIESFIISDSIILIQDTISERGLANLIGKCQNLLSITMADGIPLRGGISYGPVSIIKNERGTTIVGKGLTNAYQIEASQIWSGCVIEKKCFQLINNKGKHTLESRLAVTVPISLVCQYDTPLKSGDKKRLVVDWTKYSLLKTSDDIENAFSKHNKSTSDPHVREIIKNTVTFFNARTLIQ